MEYCKEDGRGGLEEVDRDEAMVLDKYRLGREKEQDLLWVSA